MSTAVGSNLGPSHKQASLEFGLQLLSHRHARNIGLRIPNFEQLIKKLRVNVKGPMVTSLTGHLADSYDWKSEKYISQPHVGHRFSAFWLSPRHWHDCDARHDLGSRQNDCRRELEQKPHV